MMVFITTTAHFPCGLAETSRITNYAKMMMDSGIECIVLTTSFKGGDNVKSDIPFKRMGFDYTRGGRFSLLHAYFRNNIEIIRYIKRYAKRGDVVLAYGALDPFTSMIHFTLPKWIPIIRETNEIPHYRQRFDRTIQRWIELHVLFKHFDGFIVISDTLKNVVCSYGRKKVKVVKIPILVDISEYSDIDVKEGLCSPYIFHSGSHSENKDGFIGMLTSIGLLKQKYGVEVHLYATGSCNFNENPQIFSIIQEYDIHNLVHFVGFLSKEELKQYQAGSFVFIINKYASFQNKYCFATKIGEYLASKKPIIMTRIGEAMNYFHDGLDSIIVDVNRPDLIAEEIYSLLSNPVLYNKLSENGFSLAEHEFSICAQREHIVSFIKSFSNESSLDN